MNRDDVIRMAREADPFGDDGRLVSLAMLTPGTLERFAALVAAREREACAQVCRHAMQCAINKTDSQRILELTAQLAEAQDALQAAQRLFKEALPKFNWGASFLDANAIQLLNEVPAKVNAAIKAEKVEKNGA